MVTDQNTGELCCSKCGLVVTDKIADTGAEWRSFSNDEGNKGAIMTVSGSSWGAIEKMFCFPPFLSFFRGGVIIPKPLVFCASGSGAVW